MQLDEAEVRELFTWTFLKMILSQRLFRLMMPLIISASFLRKANSKIRLFRGLLAWPKIWNAHVVIIPKFPATQVGNKSQKDVLLEENNESWQCGVMHGEACHAVELLLSSFS